MPTGYRRLTQEQRCQIYALKGRGYSQQTIAHVISAAQSTVSRELLRNSGGWGYRYLQAQKKSSLRRANESQGRKRITPELLHYVEQLLVQRQWSPEQISGWLRRHHKILISHESIYQYAWRDKRSGGTLHTHLRRRGKVYRKRGARYTGRGHIVNRVGIEKRPPIALHKRRIGDCAMDTIVGRGRKSGILSIVDRKSKLTILEPLSGLDSKTTTEAALRGLARIKNHLHTITTDNGKEFARHEEIATMLGRHVLCASV